MKAIILAAGNGTRMGDLTKDLPKPLLPYQGKPFLLHIMNRIVEGLFPNHVDFVIVINPKYKEVFQDLISSKTQSKIEWVEQKYPLGTAHALSLCGNLFYDKDDFILTYGDILFSAEDYKLFGKYSDRCYRMGINQVEDPYNGCAVYFDQEFNITRIQEKPEKGTSKSNWNGSGLFTLSGSLLTKLCDRALTLWNFKTEWNFTQFFADYYSKFAVAIPVKEWIHIENQVVYQHLIGEQK
jgi:dTDP-glucose pyrophosphorylase